jgi:glycosyltransferase involved in cell wall biosynthesis
MRATFVVQRYGLEVNGGAELLCRWLAELMRDTWDIEVLTTCALDYMTWANHYQPGTKTINGVAVRRFPVVKQRDVKRFNKLCEKVFHHPHTRQEEIEWMKAQGPDCPGLFEYISQHKHEYTIFVFFTYLYGTTFWGLPIVSDKAFLVPTSHDEPPIYLSIFHELFSKPRGFFFNTPEEKDFLLNRFNIDCTYSDIVGIGIQFDESMLYNNILNQKLPENYVLYVGRIDESKNCHELFNFWESFKSKNKVELHLVLAGRSGMKIPKRKDIVYLGFVSEKDKFEAISKAECLIMPSVFESLSMVIMESWLCNRPVLVNGKCTVLKGQCRRSNGGLWYENYDEFEACLSYILNNKDTASAMAAQGKRYTVENYSWDIIKGKWLRLINRYCNGQPHVEHKNIIKTVSLRGGVFLPTKQSR